MEQVGTTEGTARRASVTFGDAEPSGPQGRGSGPRRPARAYAALGVLALSAGLLAACSSSATASPPAACQKVSATLSDGPDADADPVGHALAQVAPLREIHTSDQDLQTAIDQLSSAYQTFVTDNGDTAAKKGVTTAEQHVDALCPGATS